MDNKEIKPVPYDEIKQGLLDSKTQHWEIKTGELTRLYWKGGIIWEGIKE